MNENKCEDSEWTAKQYKAVAGTMQCPVTSVTPDLVPELVAAECHKVMNSVLSHLSHIDVNTICSRQAEKIDSTPNRSLHGARQPQHNATLQPPVCSALRFNMGVDGSQRIGAALTARFGVASASGVNPAREVREVLLPGAEAPRLPDNIDRPPFVRQCLRHAFKTFGVFLFLPVKTREADAFRWTAGVAMEGV
ncbi:unnamed protein product [Pleuronectes platessa]|uniref:Uncharacterized protein n=1 Tax=Pleuronectes platessa TaxID=8262 RepID=A0A9N7YZI6_PLEPL|nr:unnamed protein product [Pleuronectes platessa]